MLNLLKRIRLSWPFLVLLVAYGYLGFHTFGGNLGVLKLADYSEHSNSLTNEIKNIKMKREILELRASQLRANNLDLDRLDEEARRILSLSYANEVVIWLDETP